MRYKIASSKTSVKCVIAADARLDNGVREGILQTAYKKPNGGTLWIGVIS